MPPFVQLATIGPRESRRGPSGRCSGSSYQAGGSASGALLAGVYQADANCRVVRWRRYLMDGLMDGPIAVRLVETAVSCLLAGGSPDLHACAAGEGGGVNDQYGISGSRSRLSLVDALEEGLRLGVRPTRQVGLSKGSDVGRDAVGAQRALQSGRIAQLAD